MLAVIVAATVVQLPGLMVPPHTSSDAYRYVWDGRVQLFGTSPYRFAPLDDLLADLHDPLLFPGLAVDDRSGCALPLIALAVLTAPLEWPAVAVAPDCQSTSASPHKPSPPNLIHGLRRVGAAPVPICRSATGTGTALSWSNEKPRMCA